MELFTAQYLHIVVGDPTFGGDIGFELSLSFTAVSYPILRSLERRMEGPARRGQA